MNEPIATEGQDVWTRLRRSNVLQWGGAYAAAAWALLQGVGFVADTFHWPDATKQISLLLSLIGLPIVLVLAWYHGDRGEQRVGRTELAILTLLFFVGGGIFWRYERASETAPVAGRPGTPTAAPESPPAVATDASIAVLPFVNMSPDPEQGYFADGISEELLNLLAQVPGLRVIARTSSFSFKGQQVEIAEIAHRLGVSHVLEGSVRRSGDTIRITAQLIRASDSSHLWSRTYDRQLDDVFEVQDEIAGAVVGELKIRLLGAAPTRRTTSPDAYARFLEAREVLRQFDVAAFAQSVALFRQALAIDPDYAPAWDGLAEALIHQIAFGAVTADGAIARAREVARQALALDPRYAPAYAHAALIEGVLTEGGLRTAVRYLEQGQAIDPANLEVINVAVRILRRLGRLDESAVLAEYVMTRDPVSATGAESLAYAYWMSGRPDEAAAQFRKVLELSPASSLQHAALGEILLQKGDPVRALAHFQEEPDDAARLGGQSMAYHSLHRRAESDAALAELIRKHERTAAYAIGYVLAWRGEQDRAFEWLEKAAAYRDRRIGAAAIDPMLVSLHADDRWLPFLREHDMAPEQLAAIKLKVTVPE